MNTREILEMALRVENLAENIYQDLSELFTEAKSLFKRLSVEEKQHADILTINIQFLNDIDMVPPAFAEAMVPLIEKTLNTESILLKKIMQKDITLEEALNLCLKMEEEGVEAYFQNIMRGESTSDTFNYLKQLYQDSMHHAQLIKDFIHKKEKGIST